MTIWELPEDEFHFFEAFRPALFDLEKRLPPFLLQMALVYGYTLLEAYLTEIIRHRLTAHPAHLGAKKQLTYRDVLESSSKEELVARLVDREVSRLMHEPVAAVLITLRGHLGFRRLTREYDDAVSRLSLTRNCVIHNRSKVSPKLAAMDQSLVVGQELSVDSTFVSHAIGVFRKLCTAIDREFEAL